MSNKLPQLLLTSLIQTNKAILSQKLSLLNILESKYGVEELPKFFLYQCPIVKASIGQHYRHSMDHIELAALVASTRFDDTYNVNKSDTTCMNNNISILRYDLRVRGGTLEKNVHEAKKRIELVTNVLDDILPSIALQNKTSTTHHNENDTSYLTITNQKVKAAFMLSSSSSDGEMELESTIGRELGFVAHHAIHHMAMVKIIALQTLGIEEDELPLNFGKAPSTVRFEKDNNNTM